MTDLGVDQERRDTFVGGIRVIVEVSGFGA